MKAWFLKYGISLAFVIGFTVILSAVCIPHIPADETMDRALTVAWSLSLAEAVLDLGCFLCKRDRQGNPIDRKQNIENLFLYSGGVFLFGGTVLIYTIRSLRPVGEIVFLSLTAVCGAVYGGIKLAKAIKKSKTHTREMEKTEE